MQHLNFQNLMKMHTKFWEDRFFYWYLSRIRVKQNFDLVHLIGQKRTSPADSALLMVHRTSRKILPNPVQNKCGYWDCLVNAWMYNSYLSARVLKNHEAQFPLYSTNREPCLTICYTCTHRSAEKVAWQRVSGHCLLRMSSVSFLVLHSDTV